MYIPPLFSDDADEAEIFHRKFLFVANVFVGTVVDNDTFFCVVWFDISFSPKEAGLSVICPGSDFLAAL